MNIFNIDFKFNNEFPNVHYSNDAANINCLHKSRLYGLQQETQEDD